MCAHYTQWTFELGISILGGFGNGDLWQYCGISYIGYNYFSEENYKINVTEVRRIIGSCYDIMR